MEPLEILKNYWGYNSFRPQQEEIIQSVLKGNDTLALLPTGGGKSICFQVPALALEGICIVVSPLIALMKDQVNQLKKRNIKASAIVSGMSRREIDITLDNCIYSNYKFLYVSPERLKTDFFLERAKQMNISLLAIDEAHCISQWGYDFRPAYLEISNFKNTLDIKNSIALTATATKEVKEDILAKLEMSNAKIFSKSFARKNLSYSAFNLENKEQKLIEILENVQGSSVVYCRTRSRTKHVSDFLNKNNIHADYYHAGLSSKLRATKQEAWIVNKTRVIVSTNAFGMGIDKPDVRTVVHLDIPDSLEAYYQEAGRAGRDEKNAFAVALYHTHDLTDLAERAEKSVPEIELIKKVYQSLGNYLQIAVGSQPDTAFAFDYEKFIISYNLSTVSTYHALKKLQEEGLILLNDKQYYQSKIHFILNKTETYKFQIANKTLDPIIKILLRLYGGNLFTEYVNIKISDIAQLMKINTEVVKQQLSFLHQNSIIEFVDATDSNAILFTQPRQDINHLKIDEKFLQERKKLAVKKAKSVIDYLQTTNCRTEVFQRYFDEIPKQICGICDNDLRKKNTEKGNQKLPLDEILGLLKTPLSLIEIKSKTKLSPDKITEILRILEEENRIQEKNGIFSKL